MAIDHSQEWAVHITPAGITTQLFDGNSGQYSNGPSFDTPLAMLAWLRTLPPTAAGHFPGNGPIVNFDFVAPESQQFITTIPHA